MNPNTATLRSTDICELLQVTDRSLHRWLANPYPVHTVPTVSPRGRTFALPEIVERLRKRRRDGLYGDDLARVVAFDTATRAKRLEDDLWVGNDAQGRAAAFFACLDGEETERGPHRRDGRWPDRRFPPRTDRAAPPRSRQVRPHR